MKVIHKHIIEDVNEQDIIMHQYTEILKFGKQKAGRKEQLVIWFLTDTDMDKCQAIFRLYGTGMVIGHSEANCQEYVGTTQIGAIVFHLFLVSNNDNITVKR